MWLKDEWQQESQQQLKNESEKKNAFTRLSIRFN